MFELNLEIPSRPEAGSRVPQVLRGRFRAVLPGDALDGLLAVVTELVNNSVQHGAGKPIQVRINVRQDGTVRGEIEDQGEAAIAIRETSDHREGGLGLVIVGRLTERWALCEGSTAVWFEMPAAQDEPRTRLARPTTRSMRAGQRRRGSAH